MQLKRLEKIARSEFKPGQYSDHRFDGPCFAPDGLGRLRVRSEAQILYEFNAAARAKGRFWLETETGRACGGASVILRRRRKPALELAVGHSARGAEMLMLHCIRDALGWGAGARVAGLYSTDPAGALEGAIAGMRQPETAAEVASLLARHRRRIVQTKRVAEDRRSEPGSYVRVRARARGPLFRALRRAIEDGIIIGDAVRAVDGALGDSVGRWPYRRREEGLEALAAHPPSRRAAERSLLAAYDLVRDQAAAEDAEIDRRAAAG